MRERTSYEIEKDYKRIRSVLDSTILTSINDIAKKLELTEFEVKISLSRHPRAEEKIMKQLDRNKERLKRMSASLTCNKTKPMNEKMHGVQTQEFKQKNATYSPITEPKETVYYKKKILFSAKKVGNELIISEFNTDDRGTLLISKDFEYTDGVHALNIGDEVYIAKRKRDYMTFAHYQITSLEEIDNCKLIYSQRIYNAKEISNMPKARYKTFMRDFKRRYSE